MVSLLTRRISQGQKTSSFKAINSTISRQKRQEAFGGYLFILPMILGFIVFMAGPIIYSFIMSFTNWSLGKEIGFIGFDNYYKAFFKDKDFMLSLVNTFKFTLIMAPLKIIFGLALALLLHNKIWGMHIFRTILFVPEVTTLVVWTVVWRLIFAGSNGLVNILLSSIGITGPNWLFHKSYAIYVVIFVALIKNLGFNMVLFLSALQNIPVMYNEAALIDGANQWQIFLRITLPMLSPTFFMVSILSFMGSLKVFASIYVMTNGGPAKSTYVLVYYLYQQAFKSYHFGYASAIAFVLFFIIMIVTIIQWISRRRWVHYEQ